MCGICGCSDMSFSGKFIPVNKANGLLFTSYDSNQGDESADKSRLIQMEVDLLSKNNSYAAKNRLYFQEHGIFVLNLVSSPGAGKTTLLVETIKVLKDFFPIAVIEGDQQTQHDADRIRATGVRALQINTGRACHLDAQGIGSAMMQL